MPQATDDLQLEHSIVSDFSYREMARFVRRKELTDIAKTFTANIDRVAALAELPIFLIYRMTRFMLASIDANEAVLGRSRVTAADLGRSQEIAAFIQGRQGEEKNKFANPKVDDAQGWKTALSHYMGAVFSKDGPTFLGALSLLSAMTTGAWTAYESLATDLWIAAVNLRPNDLGVNALLAKENAKGEAEPTPFSLNILRKYKFDLANSLGTMIWRERKFNFNALDGIKNAYFSTFCIRDNKGNRRGVPEEVKSWFPSSASADLAILEAIRHSLVHRGGLPDPSFRERVKGCPVLKDLNDGDRIPLNGVMVSTHIKCVLEQTKMLLEGVDKWLGCERMRNIDAVG